MTFWHTAHFTFVVVNALKTVQWCAQYKTARKTRYTLSEQKKEGSISFKKLLLRGKWAETQSKPFNRISSTSCSTGPICSAADSSLTATHARAPHTKQKGIQRQWFQIQHRGSFLKTSCDWNLRFNCTNFIPSIFEGFHRSVCSLNTHLIYYFRFYS